MGQAANTATVLIADSDLAVRQALRQTLEALGHFVVGEADTEAKVLPMTRSLRPNVLLLAAHWPGAPGLEVVRAVVAERLAPVVLMAGPDNATSTDEGGATAFILLPPRGDELGLVIRIALARFREKTALENEINELKARMEARKLVGRAKAILMERQGFTEREAFRRIQAQSAALNKPAHEIAQAIIVASEIPR